jgi:hypothetical protein
LYSFFALGSPLYIGKLNLTSNFNNVFFEAILLHEDEGREVEGDEGVEGGEEGGLEGGGEGGR